MIKVQSMDRALYGAAAVLLTIAALRALPLLTGGEWAAILVAAGGGGFAARLRKTSKRALGVYMTAWGLVGAILCGALIRAPHQEVWCGTAALGLLAAWLAASRTMSLVAWPAVIDAAAVSVAMLFIGIVGFDYVLTWREAGMRNAREWFPAACMVVLTLLVYAATTRVLWPQRAPRRNNPFVAMVDGAGEP